MSNESFILNSLADRLVSAIESSTNATLSESLLVAGRRIADSLSRSGLVLSAGNGGSMTDAMHFAEELCGRYKADRPPLRAIAVSDPSYLTCVANDYSYTEVFSRAVGGLLRSGDVCVLFSTSGESLNILNAAKAANSLGATTIALTGNPQSSLHSVVEISISPSVVVDTATAQALHTLWLHALIEIVEHELGFA